MYAIKHPVTFTMNPVLVTESNEQNGKIVGLCVDESIGGRLGDVSPPTFYGLKLVMVTTEDLGEPGILIDLRVTLRAEEDILDRDTFSKIKFAGQTLHTAGVQDHGEWEEEGYYYYDWTFCNIRRGIDVGFDTVTLYP